jgi:hypothetical protein
VAQAEDATQQHRPPAVVAHCSTWSHPVITITEKDWRIFRKLREVALERYCARVLDEAGRIATERTGSAQARYANLFELIRDRDRELASTFDNPRRSTALMQLVAMVRSGLLTAAELGSFGEEIRCAIEMWLEASG